MIGIAISVMMLLAVLSWFVAIIAAVQIVGLAPKGTKWRTYGQLGWWKFDEIRKTIGTAGDLHIRTYQRAFIVFLVIVVIAAVGGTLLGAQARN